MECRSCRNIQWNILTFRTDGISLCCEPIPSIPLIPYKETPEETLRAFVGECALIDAECRNITDDNKRYFTKGCLDCYRFQSMPYQNDRLVHYVNLSIEPAPCQSKCIYCDVHEKDQSITESAAKFYEHMFDFIQLALDRGLIANNAVWQVSSGEIAIHPYHDRFMQILKGRAAFFYTNCMKYDEDIAQTLNANPNSGINLSIDAGTRETWRKVKGIDNFDKITENLSKYYSATTRPGQISLKYIVLPGINDTYEDFSSVVEIMKVLNVQHLTISRDVYKKYNMGKQDTVNLTGAVAYLFAILYKNGMKADLLNYSAEEQKMVTDQVEEIFAKHLI